MPDKFDNRWFYDKLEAYKPELALDMGKWFDKRQGPRWRGMEENLWNAGHKEKLFGRFGQRLPKLLTDQMLYLTDKLCNITRKIHPFFETVLCEHVYAEGLLYANLDYEKYREHIIHPSKVAVLAHWLLLESGKINEIESYLRKNEYINKLLEKYHLKETVLKEDDYKIIKSALWLAGFFQEWKNVLKIFIRSTREI